MMSHHLAKQHKLTLVEGSGIAPEVIEDRGYQTVNTKAELQRLGFSAPQRLTPTLLIPIHNVYGEVVNHQHRPDNPRFKRTGQTLKPIKYETPAGSQMCLDVPPRTHRRLDDPSVPLYVTEGVKKADAAASKDLCCIALLGVWNWRGKNEHGGMTALPDWEVIALKERTVYIAFDSDVTQKREVRAAMSRLKTFLESRGADVLLINLPPREGGAKCGLDDFFVDGGTVDRLLQHARRDLPQGTDEPDAPYFEEGGCTFYRKPTSDGPRPVLLANFIARIDFDATEDDGTENRHVYRIKATVDKRERELRVEADSFQSMQWVSGLGAKAIVEPGHGIKDHLRAAIQKASDPTISTSFTHTGWRKIDDEWWFLHSSGALGCNSNRTDVDVQLPGQLDRVSLTNTRQSDSLRRDVAALVEMAQKLAPCRIVAPLIASVVRAVFGEPSFTTFLVGPTGVFKSELAAIGQSFVGRFSAADLPLSWSSTANALEAALFHAKDIPVVVDDFVATNPNERLKLMAKGERVIRSTGNRQGRQRMRPNGTLVPEKPPRGLVIATGEELPDGHSLRARSYVITVNKGDVDAGELTRAQELARSGALASVTSAFIQELADDLEGERRQLQRAAESLRTELGRAHRRTATQTAELSAAWLRFCRSCPRSRNSPPV